MQEKRVFLRFPRRDVNRPFSSCCEPNYESEVNYKAFNFIQNIVLFAFE